MFSCLPLSLSTQIDSGASILSQLSSTLCRTYFHYAMVLTCYGRLIGLLDSARQYPLVKNISSDVMNALAEIQVMSKEEPKCCTYARAYARAHVCVCMCVCVSVCVCMCEFVRVYVFVCVNMRNCEFVLFV